MARCNVKSRNVFMKHQLKRIKTEKSVEERQSFPAVETNEKSESNVLRHNLGKFLRFIGVCCRKLRV